jgi:hypothetical protein
MGQLDAKQKEALSLSPLGEPPDACCSAGGDSLQYQDFFCLSKEGKKG